MLWKHLRFTYFLAALLAGSLTVGSALAQDDAAKEKPAPEKQAAPEEKAAPEKKAAPEEKPAAEKKEEKPAKETKKAEEKKGEAAKKEEPAKEEKPAGPQPVTLVTNLENPTGIAIHKATGDVFIASRYGVYRYDPVSHTTPNIEIVGFPIDVYGKGPKYDIAPLGLGFLNETTLIVGGGGHEDGEEVVYVYEIGNEPAKPSINYKDAKATLGPIKKGHKTALGEPTTKGEGNFYDVAVGPNGVFITSNGDDTKGWIHQIKVTDGKLGDKLIPTIATKVDSSVDAPVPIEYSLDGKKLYIGQMGEISLPGDSLLLVYDPATGKMLKKYKLGLHDPCGLAISPKTKKIYVTDFAWAKADEGGLFEIVIDGDKLTTKKIVSLDKPTDIEFGKDGKLYVTVVGTVDKSAKTESGEQLSPGKLLVIDAGL